MKVMLVDDNYSMLEFMQASVPWEEMGLQLTGLCESSQEAIELSRHRAPDILITDIGMPHMNGLELIAHLKGINPALKSIIVSCHDEFEFAQQAVRLYVSEYLLKETLQPEALMQAVSRLMAEVREEEREKSKTVQFQFMIDQNKAALKKRWLETTLHNPVVNEWEWEETAVMFGLHFGDQSYMPVLGYVLDAEMTLDRFKSTDTLMYAIENVASELFEAAAGAGVTCICCHDSELLLLFSCRKSLKVNVYDNVRSGLQKLMGAIASVLKVDISFIMTEPVRGREAFRSAATACIKTRLHRFYTPEAGIYALNDFRYSFSGRDLFAHYGEALHACKGAIAAESEAELQACVAEWSGYIKREKFHPDSVRSWMHQLSLDIELKYKSIHQFQAKYALELVHQELHSLQHIGQLEAYWLRFLQHKSALMGQIRHTSQKREVLAAQQYVECNMHRKIGMEEAAKHLSLSPSHFSRIFKKETDETFIEFVIRMKMERAAEYLLKTDKTVDAIADSLGYDNVSYFIKLFKGYSGMPPLAYRNTQ
ncbi:helix-turn-helix domain-containing protein [Paenibacillus sp. J5C_2022]|uniref:helix-turn-helix domain-containing protein n=1 Tax=Paenibacillus sp. J5C2022 TaxID=2977129 RepID=UPI0021D23CA2|nr:helix-turn-helix domain-containing protein [Paenibacillus sp. J5C2022]MCU6711150.1 helix-turn-helix domain-containing protein [Paenibacillus sp. J5C2022]